MTWVNKGPHEGNFYLLDVTMFGVTQNQTVFLRNSFISSLRGC